MAIEPTGVVVVAGQTIAGTPAGTAPVALSTEFSWGRRSLFDQPDTATGQAVIFDPTGRWVSGIEARGDLDLIGEAVDLGWRDAGVTHVNLRGRVTDATIRPHDRDGYRGALVTLELTSRVAELAYKTNAAFPVEGTAARLSRLQTAAAGVAEGAVTSITSAGGGASLRARTAGTVDLLRAILDAYLSIPATATYTPDTKAITGLLRRKYGTAFGGATPARRGLAGLRRSTERTGAYIAAHTFATTGVQPASPSALYLDGRTVGDPGGGWLARGAEARLTRVETVWWGVPVGGGTSTEKVYAYTVPRSRSGLAEQVARLETEIEDAATGSANAQAVGQDFADLSLFEGGGWRPEPLTLSTAFTGGFETAAQAATLLAGAESDALIFLQATQLPRLGVRPLFAIIGGTIARTDGEWAVTVQLAPVTTVDKQHAVSWPEIDDGTTGNTLRIYLDGADHADGLHSTVTVDDLGFCSTGLGVTTPGPDTGWDTLQ